ncbi:DUF1189 family protein [Ornithinibacillus contaminans]|uniref:DUF1189 family protein n=1 Tax=Ornithinibacillus contaminans TaxID=694055 RepID=UPI00064DE5D1|nr:DUF1189 family protein [Ornithinibacillus contaminans]
MVFWETFLHSIQLPRKQSVFKLNRIPMDITVFYLFILLFLALFPTFLHQVTENTGLGSDMNLVFQFIYFFMFNYLPVTIMLFVSITVLAYIFTWIAHLLHRKLKLQILWKMIAYTTTIPLLIYAILALFNPVSNGYLVFMIVFTSVILLRVITVYPKRKAG